MLEALVTGGANVHALKRNEATELHMLHTSTTTSINLHSAQFREDTARDGVAVRCARTDLGAGPGRCAMVSCP